MAAASASNASTPFRFPREYHFPAFFTPQPNLTTRHAQLTKWSSLVLAYARHQRLFKLSVSSASETELFHNAAIKRRLSTTDIHEVLEFMRRDGRAEYVGGPKANASIGGSGGGGGEVVYLYWHTPDEWAALIEAYVEDTAQKGTVLTVYELTEGEGTRGTGKSAQLSRRQGRQA